MASVFWYDDVNRITLRSSFYNLFFELFEWILYVIVMSEILFGFFVNTLQDGRTALDLSLCFGRDFKSYDLAKLVKLIPANRGVWFRSATDFREQKPKVSECSLVWAMHSLWWRVQMQLKETRRELSVLVIRQFFLTVDSKRSDRLLYDCAIRILSMVCL